jgi:hypothetical protein
MTKFSCFYAFVSTSRNHQFLKALLIMVAIHVPSADSINAQHSAPLLRATRGCIPTSGYTGTPCCLPGVLSQCGKIIFSRIFGYIINTTVFFVHDFAHFCWWKPEQLSRNGKGMKDGTCIQTRSIALCARTRGVLDLSGATRRTPCGRRLLQRRSIMARVFCELLNAYQVWKSHNLG